jgi:hypothetical protein
MGRSKDKGHEDSDGKDEREDDDGDGGDNGDESGHHVMTTFKLA